MKFDTWAFFEPLSRKFEFHQCMTRIMGNLHEDVCTCMIIPRWIPLRARNVTDKSCRENQNTYFVFSKFFSEDCAVYEMMMEKYGRARQATDDSIARRMRFAWRVTKATDVRSEYLILNAFSLQQWLGEGASMLRYTHTACLILTF
jgi:hypothetical protein